MVFGRGEQKFWLTQSGLGRRASVSEMRRIRKEKRRTGLLDRVGALSGLSGVATNYILV